MSNLTHTHTPNKFFNLSADFHRHIINVLDVSRTIRDHYRLSKTKGWQNVSLPYPVADACISQLDESAEEVTHIFEGTKQALIHSEKNRIIAEQIAIQPVEKTINDFKAGKASAGEMQAAIDKLVGIRKHPAS